MGKPKPLLCSLDEAREGIQLMAIHVERLCESSGILCEESCENGNPRLLRQAAVLTLLALEETGKLFEVWQAASGVEDQGRDQRVVIPNFRDHSAKGRKVGDLCHRMIAFVRLRAIQGLRDGPIPGVANGISKENIDRTCRDWDDHFNSLCQTFERERVLAMYVDHLRGSWTAESPLTWTHVEMDNQLLEFVAVVAKAYFDSGERSFSLALRALKKLEEGIEDADTGTFILRVREGLTRGSNQSH